MDFILAVVGYFLLFMASDVGRSEEEKIGRFTRSWWIRAGLILAGGMILQIFSK